MPPVVLAALTVSGVALVVAGVALVSRTPARIAGTLFAISGVVAVGTVVAEVAGSEQWWIGATVAVMLLCAAVMTYPMVTWPDPALVIALLALVLVPVFLVGTPVAIDDLLVVATMMGLVTLAQAWWRLETLEVGQRRTLTWVLVVCGVLCLLLLVVAMVEWVWLVAVAVLGFAAVGGAAWFGITRPQVIDVRAVVVSVVVNLTACLAVFVVYELLLLGWEALGGGQLSPAGYGALALVPAVLFQPIRRQLQLVTDELLFGARPDPLAAAHSIALGVGDDPATALEALRTALVLPYAALRVDAYPLTESGRPAAHAHTHALPLVHDEEEVGELVVGLRPGDLRLHGDDAKVLGLAAPLLAQTVRAKALAEHLQSAREVATSAREEERRRLRRDLHDGLGPRLSGIAFHADAARLAMTDPDDAEQHLQRVRVEAVRAIGEIRDLVYGMRPPALDEVGLIEAIRLQTASLRSADGRPMRIHVESEELPPLGAAVEVAAYRIVVEALCNAARHSGSDRAEARLSGAGHLLRLEVRDHGSQTDAWALGVGLSSMRERAAELGGMVTFEPSVVLAELPLGTPI